MIDWLNKSIQLQSSWVHCIRDIFVAQDQEVEKHSFKNVWSINVILFYFSIRYQSTDIIMFAYWFFTRMKNKEHMYIFSGLRGWKLFCL